MEKNEGLYQLIYDYYESRILFGSYRYGEPLSSVSQICANFRLGRNTVQAALNRLEKNGYIKTEERKVARVIYQATEEDFRENAANFFVPRREGILDFGYVGELMFAPLWNAGVQNLKQGTPDYAYWNQNKEKGTVPVPIKVYCDVLSTFHNELLLNLYWQCLRYLNFLYPPKNREENDRVAELIARQEMDELKREIDGCLDGQQAQVLEFVDFAAKAYHLESVAPVRFHWTIYRRRPQVRYTLASVIIREILRGSYPVGTYLPSLPGMAEQYQVSLSTVRRTLEVLSALGVTRTYMGIGTKVCLEPVDIDILNGSEIRENLRLHGEGMQILALTVRGVTLFTLESAAKEKREQLLQQMIKLHGRTSSILYIDVLLSFIAAECPSAIIRECYDKLRELAAWGYIFSAVLLRNGQLSHSYTGFLEKLEADLRAGDLAAFSDQWQLFIKGRIDFLYSSLPLKNV